jgi:hypothetical protein
MWLFGAGSSATAGIATANEMLWEFKRAVYCSMEKVSIKKCGDLSDERTKYQIQNYLKRVIPNCPEPWAEDEYSFFFEQAYAKEADRRAYLDSKIKGASPSFGHEALGILMKLGLVRLIWTTNFDRVVEDVAVRALGSTSKIVAPSLDHSDLGLEAINEERWPVYMKMHGDFQSRRLKNTSHELANQDSKMRQAMQECCRRSGLAVVGYSGRDNSVMESLEGALAPGAFPGGLFWFRRSSKGTYPRVTTFIEKAKELGIESDFIETESFDELFGDIVNQVPNVPDELLGLLKSQKSRFSEAPMPPFNDAKTFPVIRLNALPITEYPSITRLIECTVGGTKEVIAAVEASGSKAIAARTTKGVIAFGTDAELRKAFDSFGITNFDLHKIDAERLQRQSAELGLIYEALLRAITRTSPLILEKRGRDRMLYVDSRKQTDSQLATLKSCSGTLSGNLGGHTWAEAVRLRLDYKFNHLWLIFEPAIWISNVELKEFVRHRMSKRYNGDWNLLLGGWAKVLGGPGDGKKYQALNIASGVDAVFSISATTAFSRRSSQ